MTDWGDAFRLGIGLSAFLLSGAVIAIEWWWAALLDNPTRQRVIRINSIGAATILAGIGMAQWLNFHKPATWITWLSATGVTILWFGLFGTLQLVWEETHHGNGRRVGDERRR
jgi:hypothetical protein